MEYAGPLCEPNPPFLCAPLSRDRAFFFSFFFSFFFFRIPSIRKDCSAIRQGHLFFFFPLEFYRAEIERVTDQFDQQNLNFLLPLFFFFFFFSYSIDSKGIFILSGKEIFSFSFFPRILFIYLLYHYYYFIYYNFLYQGRKSFLLLFFPEFYLFICCIIIIILFIIISSIRERNFFFFFFRRILFICYIIIIILFVIIFSNRDRARYDR